MGLMGMAQVVATIAYGIQGLRRGEMHKAARTHTQMSKGTAGATARPDPWPLAKITIDMEKPSQ